MSSPDYTSQDSFPSRPAPKTVAGLPAEIGPNKETLAEKEFANNLFMGKNKGAAWAAFGRALHPDLEFSQPNKNGRMARITVATWRARSLAYIRQLKQANTHEDPDSKRRKVAAAHFRNKGIAPSNALMVQLMSPWVAPAGAPPTARSTETDTIIASLNTLLDDEGRGPRKCAICKKDSDTDVCKTCDEAHLKACSKCKRRNVPALLSDDICESCNQDNGTKPCSTCKEPSTLLIEGACATCAAKKRKKKRDRGVQTACSKPACPGSILAGAKFCHECGTGTTDSKCISCSSAVAEDASVCTVCRRVNPDIPSDPIFAQCASCLSVFPFDHKYCSSCRTPRPASADQAPDCKCGFRNAAKAAFCGDCSEPLHKAAVKKPRRNSGNSRTHTIALPSFGLAGGPSDDDGDEGSDPDDDNDRNGTPELPPPTKQAPAFPGTCKFWTQSAFAGLFVPTSAWRFGSEDWETTMRLGLERQAQIVAHLDYEHQGLVTKRLAPIKMSVPTLKAISTPTDFAACIIRQAEFRRLCFGPKQAQTDLPYFTFLNSLAVMPNINISALVLILDKHAKATASPSNIKYPITELPAPHFLTAMQTAQLFAANTKPEKPKNDTRAPKTDRVPKDKSPKADKRPGRDPRLDYTNPQGVTIGQHAYKSTLCCRFQFGECTETETHSSGLKVYTHECCSCGSTDHGTLACPKNIFVK
jgi:hypothetical protein